MAALDAGGDAARGAVAPGDGLVVALHPGYEDFRSCAPVGAEEVRLRSAWSRRPQGEQPPPSRSRSGRTTCYGLMVAGSTFYGLVVAGSTFYRLVAAGSTFYGLVVAGSIG